MVELVAKRYANALIGIDGGNKIDKFIVVLDAIASELKTPKAKDIITSPLVSANDKITLILDALNSEKDPMIIQLIKVMGNNGRLALIPDLVEMLKFEKQKESNSFTGKVESKNRLDDLEITNLEKILTKYSSSNIKLKQIRSDMCGIKIEVEDLGLEINFSKDLVKLDLLDYIQKAF